MLCKCKDVSISDAGRAPSRLGICSSTAQTAHVRDGTSHQQVCHQLKLKTWKNLYFCSISSVLILYYVVFKFGYDSKTLPNVLSVFEMHLQNPPKSPNVQQPFPAHSSMSKKSTKQMQIILCLTWAHFVYSSCFFHNNPKYFSLPHNPKGLATCLKGQQICFEWMRIRVEHRERNQFSQRTQHRKRFLLYSSTFACISYSNLVSYSAENPKPLSSLVENKFA